MEGGLVLLLLLQRSQVKVYELRPCNKQVFCRKVNLGAVAFCTTIVTKDDPRISECLISFSTALVNSTPFES